MKLIPKPYEVEERDGTFTMGMGTSIIAQGQPDLRSMINELKDHVYEVIGLVLTESPLADKDIRFLMEASEFDYEIVVEKDEIVILSGHKRGLFHGLQTLKQLIQIHGRHVPCMIIRDKPIYKDRGFYHDVTRGKVPNLNTLKTLVDTMAYFKLNQLQLYIEHTYLYTGQSEVWSVSDPLTAEEIMELDAYCADRYIELVPSISTFGHLYEALQTDSFNHLSEFEAIEGFSFFDRMRHHTLDVTNDESFEFVKRMIDDFIPLVRSNKFNICADETFDLGEGRSKEAAQKVGKSKLYVDFLKKIIAYVKSYGKEVMFWGDVILTHPESSMELPKDMICLNWWYDEDYPENKVKGIADHGFRQYMCPGVNGWNTLMNDHRKAYKNIEMMSAYGEKYSATGLLNTDWGDFGHVNMLQTSYPGLIYGAAFAWGDKRSFESMNESIEAVFYRSKGLVMDALITLSDAHLMTFYHLVKWFEKDDKEVIRAIDVSEADVEMANDRIVNSCESLLDSLANLDQDTRQQIHSYLVAAEGIMLLNRLLLVIKERECCMRLISPIDNRALAEEIEYWFLSYKKIWLRDNKPSELYRIQDFIRRLMRWLRKA